MLLAACLLSWFASSGPTVAQGPESARMRFTVPFEGEKCHDAATLAIAVDVYKQRLGSRSDKANIRADAKRGEISVELPLRSAFDALPLCKLTRELAADSDVIETDAKDDLPFAGAATIDGEWVGYSAVTGAALSRVHRGNWGTKASAHAAGSSVEIFAIDAMAVLLFARGELAFLQVAKADYLSAQGTSFGAEQERLHSWIALHEGARLSDFDGVGREKGGPLSGTVWRRQRADFVHAQDASQESLLMLPADEHTRFVGSDMARFDPCVDQFGYPAISFDLKSQRATEFADWTARIIGCGMAVVLDDEILVQATVNSRLAGAGIIEGGSGGFTKSEVASLLRLLRAPALPLRPGRGKTELVR